jgi:hypothetical protein
LKLRHALLLLASVAALRLLAALSPSGVERLYSRGIYPGIAAVLTALTSWTRQVIGEPLVVGAALLLSAWLVRRIRSARGHRWLAAFVTLPGLAAALYLLFLVVWGLNYERRPLLETAALEAGRPTDADLERLAADLVHAADVLRTGLREDDRGVFRLERGLQATLVRVPAGFAEAGRVFPWLRGPRPAPKVAAASSLLSRLGISGIYLPFTAEPLVDGEIPDCDVPFAACHETAHAAGFAREEDASYAGSLACRLNPDADFRYSAFLIASAYAVGALSRGDPGAAWRLHDSRGEGTRRDLAALAEWSARHEGRVSRASRRVNDAYLRSQGQRGGIASYGRFVDLLLAERRTSGRLVGTPP